MKSFRLQESPRRKAMRELYKIQPKATSMSCTSMNKVLIQESVFILVLKCWRFSTLGLPEHMFSKRGLMGLWVKISRYQLMVMGRFLAWPPSPHSMSTFQFGGNRNHWRLQDTNTHTHTHTHTHTRTHTHTYTVETKTRTTEDSHTHTYTVETKTRTTEDSHTHTLWKLKPQPLKTPGYQHTHTYTHTLSLSLSLSLCGN